MAEIEAWRSRVCRLAPALCRTFETGFVTVVDPCAGAADRGIHRRLRQHPVSPPYEKEPGPIAPPDRILMHGFAVSTKGAKENPALYTLVVNSFDSSSQNQPEFEIGRQVADRMADDLVEGIRQLGLRSS